MKEEMSSSSSSSSSCNAIFIYASLFGKGRYKFWVLAVVVLLTFWSMFTGSVTLRWSSGSINHLSPDARSPLIHDDLDVLELEERKKVVKGMWDVYAHNHVVKLPKFWQEAFEAAYEHLTSEDQGAREAAVSEIAKMSVRSIDFGPHAVQSAISGHFAT